ncbi:MAG: aldo/keto reductase [Nocardioidaceae bacterium]
MPTSPTSTLNNGVEIPQVGFGVFLIPAAETKAAVTSALGVGYRHIDTASAYGNEEAVGEAISESGISRDDLFVTTKCWNDEQGYDQAPAAYHASLDRLGLDYVDLYLIHWPVPARGRFVETWQALEKLNADGRVRAVGVSNFQPHHLQRLFDETGTVPAINQVELHPYLTQQTLRAFHEEHGIVTEAWSPIARGGELLTDRTVTALAEKYGVTPAQLVLRWHLELGNVVIPKSVRPERMAANLDLFGFELAADDVATLSALDRSQRVGPDPEKFDR